MGKLINLHKAYNTMDKVVVPALSFQYLKHKGTVDYSLEGDFAKYVNLEGKRKQQFLAFIDILNIFSGNLSKLEIAVNKEDLPKAVQRIDAILDRRLSGGSRKIESNQDQVILYPGKNEFLLPIRITSTKPNKMYEIFKVKDVYDWFWPHLKKDKVKK